MRIKSYKLDRRKCFYTFIFFKLTACMSTTEGEINAGLGHFIWEFDIFKIFTEFLKFRKI